MTRRARHLALDHRPKASAGDDGFAAVDALVALLILSATLVLCLDNLRSADRLARIAEETGQATCLARAVLTTAPVTGDQDGGLSGGLRWSLTEQSAEGPGVLCARTLLAKSVRDGRIYRFTTARPCA